MATYVCTVYRTITDVGDITIEANSLKEAAIAAESSFNISRGDVHWRDERTDYECHDYDCREIEGHKRST